MKRKGQTAIEYLVLILVVLIILMAVMSILSSISDVGRELGGLINNTKVQVIGWLAT